MSNSSIRWRDGGITTVAEDVVSAGLGMPWGHRRAYSNQLTHDYDFGNGFNWMVESWPFLVERRPGQVAVIYHGRKGLWFDRRGEAFAPQHGALQALVHDEANRVFRLSDPDGTVWEFHDFSQRDHLRGMFNRVRSPGGQITAVTRYADDRVAEIQRSTDGDTASGVESYLYNYIGSGGNAGRLETLTVRRSVAGGPWQEIARVRYTYYESWDSYGSRGDLKTVVQQHFDGGQWVDGDTTYYRYYTAGQSGGFVHGLKYVLLPQAFANLAADAEVGSPFTAPDAKVAAYACNYFEYDGRRRVVKEVVDGGDQQYTYTFTDGTPGEDYNEWAAKTVETLADGSRTTVYTNFVNNVLLKDRQAGDDHWIEYNRFDGEGRTVLAATPAAVAGYTARIDASGTAVLDVELRPDEGLINLQEFYPTSGDPGPDYAAPGQLRYEMIQRGSQGTPILLSEYRYACRDFNGGTLHFQAAAIRYADNNRPITTSHSHSQWHGDTAQFRERVTTLPAIAVEHNGSGQSARRVERFDALGNRVWLKDERGFITAEQYDPVTGGRTRLIRDVDGAKLALPEGWSTPAGGGLHLITDYTVDAQGRTTEELGPEHDVEGRAVRTARWTLRLDAVHEARAAKGWFDVATGTRTLVNPVTIRKEDAQGRELEVIRAIRTSTAGPLSADDQFPQSSYCRWTVNAYVNNRLSSTGVYHAIPAEGEGEEGVNYARTDYDYDALGRQNYVRTPGGTITRTVLGVRGSALRVFVGTNDSGATDADPTGGGAHSNNMVLVTENEYDHGRAGGPGDLTTAIRHLDATTKRVTNHSYDWRGRQVAVQGEEGLFQKTDYDQLDRAVRQEQYAGSAGGHLLARNETLYDDHGRVYRSLQYGVEPSSGAITGTLAGDTWFDAAGQVIKQQPAGARAFTKTAYDSLGRAVVQYTGFDVDEALYAEVASVADDTILEQAELQYDAADHALATVSRRRVHTASDDQTGPLQDQAHDPKARVSYSAFWYDGVGRPMATASYGNHDGPPPVRPSQVPERSDSVLVASIEYNDRGEAPRTIDSAGRTLFRAFDDTGRQTAQVVDYVDGVVDAGHPDEDVTVLTTYNADGKVAISIAVNPATGDQVTQYVYGTSLADSGVARADLLRCEIYPDSTDAADRVSYTYNRLGEIVAKTDQNGTVHAYLYDGQGRRVTDSVTTLGAGVDGAVRRIDHWYGADGRLASVTSHSSPTAAAVLNQVAFQYGPFGHVIAESQEHRGAVNARSAPRTQYVYADCAAGHTRLTALVYPDGRAVGYRYAAGTDDSANRISFLTEGVVGESERRLVEYSYVGAGSIVEAVYPEPGIRCTYDADPGAPGTYPGLDRFDRIADLLWQDVATGAALEHIQHGYDRAGNRLWRRCPVATAIGHSLDEHYTYDRLNRLTALRRGRLDAARVALLPESGNFTQAWAFDATDNWAGFREGRGAGSHELDQARVHGPANEIVSFAGRAGGDWAKPAYDRNGNMLSVPRPQSPAASLACVYDAWNRLVRVSEGAAGQVIAEYEYDGRDFRIVARQRKSPGGGALHARHFYYSNDWQVLEERIDDSLAPDRQFVWGQRYVDDLVLCDQSVRADKGGAERLFAIQDPNWNVTALVDAGGEVIERYTYSAYGQPAFLEGNFGDRGASGRDAEVLYCGYRWEAALGSSLARNRVLWPHLGRWNRRDPLGFGADGANPYGYVRGRPVGSTDPSGAVTVTRFMPLRSDLKCDEEAHVSWMFALNNPAKHDGYIVQQVDVRCQIEVGKGKCPEFSPKKPDYSYWEAWPISANDPNASVVDAADGEFNALGTCGNYSQVTTIKFFYKSTTGDLAAKGWAPNNFHPATGVPQKCRTTSSEAIATDDLPSWFAGRPDHSEAVGKRVFSVFWNCRGSERKVIPIASPS